MNIKSYMEKIGIVNNTTHPEYNTTYMLKTWKRRKKTFYRFDVAIEYCAGNGMLNRQKEKMIKAYCDKNGYTVYNSAVYGNTRYFNIMPDKLYNAI